MTQKEFNELPLLLSEKETLAALGYSRNTLRKMVENNVLRIVLPPGTGQGRYQKKQISKLLGFEV